MEPEKTEDVERAARSGDAGAQAELGMRYLNGGWGLAADPTRAAYWYRLASEQGHVGAQSSLADMYAEGRGVAKDPAESFRWRLKAAEGGSDSAERVVADSYLEGRGTPRNDAQANKWYQRVIARALPAAQEGNYCCQELLGHFYLHGKGVPQDISVAIDWFLKSARRERSLAFSRGLRENGGVRDLEDIYLAGSWPVEKMTEAFSWFREAAADDFPRSQYILGILFREGWGVVKDLSQALHWFQKAADHSERVEWPKLPTQGSPVVPEALLAVDEIRKALLTTSPTLTFGGVDDLCEAVRIGNHQRVKALIKGGAPVNPPPGTPSERCPFLIAISKTFPRGEVRGIRGGYSPERHDYWNRQQDNAQILETLVENGAAVFPLAYTQHSTSLHAAAQADNACAIRIILKKHPDAFDYIDGTAWDEPTPLEIAAEWGSFLAIKALSGLRGIRWHHTSPFELALKKGFMRTAKELLDYMPDKLRLEGHHSQALFEMLLWCAVDNDAKAFRALWSKCQDTFTGISKRTDRGCVDLWREKEAVLEDCFAYASHPAPHMELLKLIFDAADTLDINTAKTALSITARRPPLLLAAEQGNLEFAEFCLRSGADPFVAGGADGMTPLEIARQKGYTKLAVLLERETKRDYGGRLKSWFRKLAR